MFDIVSVGGATQDIFLYSPNYQVKGDDLVFEWGEKFVVEDMLVDVGGGACNSAVGFSRLGLKTAIWCRIGDDAAGRFAQSRLESEGVDRSFLRVEQSGRTSFSSIFVDETGERSIVMFRGRNDLLDKENIDLTKLFETRWIFVSELTGNPTPLVKELAARAQQEGVKLAFVPGLNQLEEGVDALKSTLAKSNVLIFNSFEATKLLGKPESFMESSEKIKEMLKELADYGLEVVVITRDKDGVQAFDGRQFYAVPAPAVDRVVDTTGAGDAFASGFISILVKGGNIEEALAAGSKNAGSVIQQFGAQTGLLRISNI
jgi:sugar/nucleoside kinase (ribokinase family)